MTVRAALALLLALAACGGRDGQAPEPPPVQSAQVLSYVALGDSTGFGIGALPGDGGYPPRLARRIRDAGRPVDLVNLSVPGATARDLADVQAPAALRFQAGLVTVCIGANDADRGRSPAEFAADLETIYAAVARLGGPVIVCNIPDLTLAPAEAGKPPSFAALLVALNAEVAAAAARHRFAVVDLYAASRPQLLARPELLSPDGFHPSAAGYEVWADLMLPAVKAALGLR